MRNNSIGKSGEYFVAGELERRGYQVAILLGNEEFYDVLAVSKEGKEIIIQVKTTFTKRMMWTLSNNKIKVSQNFFYIFVSLNQLNQPSYHIVPGKVVFDYVSQNGMSWKTTLRRFNDTKCLYLNRWDLLNSTDY